MTLSIRNKINIHSRLVLFPLHFTKFSLNTVSIRVKFGSSKEKITTRGIYIYLISDTRGWGVRQKKMVCRDERIRPLIHTKQTLNQKNSGTLYFTKIQAKEC